MLTKGAAPAQTAPPARQTACAAVCRALAEPMAGTAPAAALGWLLIEHPGPWPAFGLPSDIAGPLADYAQRSLAAGVRTQLIRRPEREGRVVQVPEIMIAGGPPGRRWLERLAPGDVEVLTGLEPAVAFASDTAPGIGAPLEAALLVCTHGRREVCCAQYGRPVARALSARFGDVVWETTHVGGDRFAASVVALPSAAYFGRLDPESAVQVAEACLSGDIDLEHYRGTAGMPAAAQAAEWFLRRQLKERRIDALRLAAYRRQGTAKDEAAPSGGTARFELARQGTFEVAVSEHPAPCPRLTSCGEGTVEHPLGYRLDSISATPLTCSG